MKDTEKLELLKAVLAVAAADGEIKPAEKGLIEGLAVRIGVGRASLEAMRNAALRGETVPQGILMQSPESVRTALELLVAEARIDGAISDQERRLLIRIGDRLKITGEEFEAIYRAGITRADEIRKRPR